jgi:MscS family membrane protein
MIRRDSMELDIFGWKIPLPEWASNEYFVAAALILLWIGIALVITFVVDRYIKKWAKKTKTELDDIILGVLKTPLLLILISAGIVSALKIISAISGYMSYIDTAYQIILIFAVIWLIAKLYKALIGYYGKVFAKKTKSKVDDILMPTIEKVGLFVIYFLGIMTILSYLGIDILPLITGMGIMGLAIALAVKDTLSNFMAGFFLLMDQPFKVGDRVELGKGEIYDVVAIGPRNTQLYNIEEHSILVLPNGKLANAKVVNRSMPDLRRKEQLSFGVGHNTDIERVEKIVLDIAKQHPHILEAPKPNLRVMELGDYLLKLEFSFWIDSIKNRKETIDKLNRNILEKFKKEEIKIGR